MLLIYEIDVLFSALIVLSQIKKKKIGIQNVLQRCYTFELAMY